MLPKDSKERKKVSASENTLAGWADIIMNTYQCRGCGKNYDRRTSNPSLAPSYGYLCPDCTDEVGPIDGG